MVLPNPTLARRLALVACLLIAGVTASCGANETAEPARLVVREELPATPRYIEGAVPFLRVERVGAEEPVFEGPAADGHEPRAERPLFVRRLPPGVYRLLSYQRPCQGNCEVLDPPTDRCQTEFKLASGQHLAATVVRRQGGGCVIRIG